MRRPSAPSGPLTGAPGVAERRHLRRERLIRTQVRRPGRTGLHIRATRLSVMLIGGSPRMSSIVAIIEPVSSGCESTPPPAPRRDQRARSCGARRRGRARSARRPRSRRSRCRASSASARRRPTSAAEREVVVGHVGLRRRGAGWSCRWCGRWGGARSLSAGSVAVALERAELALPLRLAGRVVRACEVVAGVARVDRVELAGAGA